MTRHLYAAFLIFTVSFSAYPASFTDNAVERHRPYTKVPIASAVLNESVDIYIQLPFKYDSDFTQNYRYPVYYVLDAPVGLPLVSGILEPLNGYNNAPPMIIVGISTSNRNRDYTPTFDPDYETHGGGADKFLTFIEDEVIPYIEENFRTEKFRIISGHSYGGLFAAHSFHTRPTLFQAHFAHSPALFWENNETVKQLITFIKNNPKHKNFLYMNMGNEGNPESESPEGLKMLQGVQAIELALTSSDTPNLDYKFEYFKDEPHQNTPIYGAIGALRGLYPQWSIPYKTSTAGYDSVMAHFQHLSNRYGYKIEPKDWQIYDEGVSQLTHFDNPTEAIKYFNYNIQRDPSAHHSRGHIVDAYIKIGAIEDALKHLNILIARDEISDKERQELTDKKAALIGE